MFTITIGGDEQFDNINNVFIEKPRYTIEIEHSLISVSKWESKHKVPFLDKDGRTKEQLLDYVKCMVVTPGFDVSKIESLSSENITLVNDYMNSQESATTFGMTPKKEGREERITSELIYYWMVAFKIPWEAQSWHLNRLFALIRICNLKQADPKKRNAAEIAAWQRQENARRLQEYDTSG